MPFGTSSASLSRYVKAVVTEVKKTPEISYTLTPMATVVEGSLENVLALARRVHEIPFGMGVARVLTSIVIDDRRDKEITMDSKVKAIS